MKKFLGFWAFLKGNGDSQVVLDREKRIYYKTEVFMMCAAKETE